MKTNRSEDALIIPVGGELPPADPTPVASVPPTTRQPATSSPQEGRRAARPKKNKRALARFRQINTFCDETLATLERAELAVWLLLWRDTRPDGRARVGQADLARRAGCAIRTARRALARLEELGLVETVYQGGWPRRVSVYRVAAVPDPDRAG